MCWCRGGLRRNPAWRRSPAASAGPGVSSGPGPIAGAGKAATTSPLQGNDGEANQRGGPRVSRPTVTAWAASLPCRRVVRLTEVSEIRLEDPVELGRVLWIGLEPQFPTARRALGIHHDPSAGMGPESGTDGCIGLIRGSDLLTLAALLEHSGTHDLVVIQ